MAFKNSIRTIYGSLVQSAGRWGDQLRILPNSTLNQKFSVQPDALPYEGERVFTKYLAIGLKGITMDLQTNGLYLVKFRNYEPSQASLFEHIPFIMRRLSDDLTPSERAKYRLRVIREYNGILYACYFLRLLENTGIPASAEKRVVANSIISAKPWEPVLENLNPSTTSLNAGEAVSNGDVHLAASKKIQIVFTPSEIQEIMSCANIIYGNPGFAELSEFGIVSGVDRSVSGDFNGIQENYTEAIAAQINDFVLTRVSCPDCLGGKEINIDAGSVEPLTLATN